jgi:hypothetical protein
VYHTPPHPTEFQSQSFPSPTEKEEIKLLGDALWVQEMKEYARASKGPNQQLFGFYCLKFPEYGLEKANKCFQSGAHATVSNILN